MNELIKKLLKIFKNQEKDKALIDKKSILKWLSENDRDYRINFEYDSYEFIDLHDEMNQSLLNQMLKKDGLPSDYFKNLKKEGHRFIINSKKNIELLYQKKGEIPVQFYHVEGNFFCRCSGLRTLKGCPHSVSGFFDCSFNVLESFKGCPQLLGGGFYCQMNQIKSLEYCPQLLGGHLYCNDNQLISLEYFPSSLNGRVFIKNNTGLLKYKNENISDEKFFDNQEYDFWYKIHLQEKAIKENEKINDILDMKGDNQKIKIKKL